MYCTGERDSPKRIQYWRTTASASTQGRPVPQIRFLLTSPMSSESFLSVSSEKNRNCDDSSFHWRTRSLVLNFVRANGNNLLALKLPGLLIHACSISKVIARYGTLHLIDPFLASRSSYLHQRIVRQGQLTAGERPKHHSLLIHTAL